MLGNGLRVRGAGKKCYRLLPWKWGFGYGNLGRPAGGTLLKDPQAEAFGADRGGGGVGEGLQGLAGDEAL